MPDTDFRDLSGRLAAAAGRRRRGLPVLLAASLAFAGSGAAAPRPDGGDVSTSVEAPAPAGALDPRLLAAFRASGMGVHLGGVEGIVRAETAAARADCAAPPALDALAPARLERFALDALADALTADDLAAITRFHASPPGVRVLSAERASGDLDEAAFERHIAALAASPSWTPARRGRLRRMLSVTRTGELVATLNGGIDGAVAAAALCDADAATLERLSLEAATRRADATFHGFFLAGELVAPSGAVYGDIDDGDLDALVAFAATPAGKRWHAALVEATGASLERARERLVTSVSGVRGP